MGFDGKTPKPGQPTNKTGRHVHSFFDHRKNKWVDVNCWCATGKDHRTPKA